MRNLFAFALLVLAPLAGQAAETWPMGIPLDVVQLGHDDRRSLQMLFHNAGLDGQPTAANPAPLDTFWTTWNQASLGRAVRSLTGVQKIAFEYVIPRAPFSFEVLYDSKQAIDKVAKGELLFAWVEGDVLRDSAQKSAVLPIAYGRFYFDTLDQEDFVLVGRVEAKLPSLGLLDAEGMKKATALVQRNDLHFGYGSAPEEALKPFRDAHINPFSADGAISPRDFVHKYVPDMNGVDLLIAGAQGKPGLDLVVLDPSTWKFYQSEYPGRSKWATAVWTTPEFTVLARPGELVKDHFDPNDTASLQYLKTARLQILTYKGREAFTKQLSVSEIGRRALAREVPLPPETSLDDDESTLDAVAGKYGLDVAVVRKRSLDSYTQNKPGAGRALQVIGTLPPVPNPVFIGNPQRVGKDLVAWLQAALRPYNWRTAKTFAGGMILLRNFTRYSFPGEGDAR